jgi:hypothetical protein
MLPIDGQIGVRHLKISNSPSIYLHLSSVKILIESFMPGAQSGLTFVSNRTDGLGERLKALVNAIALSRYFGGRFSFSWDPISSSVADSHAIGLPSDIFAEDFLKAHLTKSKATVTLNNFLAAEREGRPLDEYQILAPQTSIYNASRSLRSFITLDDLRDSFWNIKFSEKMARAIAAAQSVPIEGEGIGLHMRAGDIVYGRYRFNSRYMNKVVPFPLSVAFIESERKRGNNVIIFGQDHELCSNISSKHGAIFSGDFHARYNFDIHQAAIFDIILMSRCIKVVAGNSGFSQIAQVVGSFELLDPRSILPRAEACSVLRRFLVEGVDNYLGASNLQQAFCRIYFVSFFDEYISSEELEGLLREALAMDKGNSFYACILAFHLFQSGKSSEAEELLDFLVSPEFPFVRFGSLLSLIYTRHPDGTLALKKYQSSIRAMADSGINVAIGIHALLCLLLNDENAFRSYLAMYRFGSSGQTSSLDAKLEQYSI